MLSHPASLFVMASMLFVVANNLQPVLPHSETLEPEFVTERVFGYSTQGQEILGYEIGHGHECLMFFGGIHGNERGTVALMNKYVHELKAHPELVPDDKRLLVIPLANPDGYYHRNDKLNASNVNLNRNFMTDDWIQQEGDKETYAGTAPFSEVETRVLRDAANICDPTVMMAFHSKGALVSPEFNDASMHLADWYAVHTGYEYFDEWDYAGTATRWFVETTDQAAITVELTNHEDSDWKLNRRALLEILRH